MITKYKARKTTFGVEDTNYYYLAPEKLQVAEDDDNENDEVMNEKSDVYSFAMIVFEIISNERPFNKQDKSSVLIHKIINDKYRPVLSDTIPSCFKQLIERCWSSDPNTRPSFSEIVEELETNEEFINIEVNKEKYNDCIQYLKNNQKENYFNNLLNELFIKNKTFPLTVHKSSL